MKISIIIPAYNEEKYVAKTVDAALKQTYPDFEVIVVNNNSTDGTKTVVSQYLSDSRLSLIDEPKQGLLFARNAGLAHATGEVLAQLDADCIPDHDWLATAAPYFEKQDVVALSGPYDYFDAAWYFRYFMLLNQKFFFGFMNWFIQKRKMGAFLIGGNAFIRTEALRKAGGYNTDLAFYAEDIDTACRVAKFGKIMYLSNLVVKTSARRFKQQGFFTIQKKYNTAFFTMMRGRSVDQKLTTETVHPR